MMELLAAAMIMEHGLTTWVEAELQLIEKFPKMRDDALLHKLWPFAHHKATKYFREDVAVIRSMQRQDKKDRAPQSAHIPADTRTKEVAKDELPTRATAENSEVTITSTIPWFNK
jgi:lysozyme family protein